jgi:hypothetical protein
MICDHASLRPPLRSRSHSRTDAGSTRMPTLWAESRAACSPSCTLLLPGATEGLRVCGPVVALKAWGLFQRLRVHRQEEGA